MARIARAVVPEIPHHITQRGNRRQPTFFSSSDYQTYVDLMHAWCEHHGVAVWAYSLMPNHVHLVAVPRDQESLARAIGEAHRRYTRLVNEREGWRGHLWQGRFASYVMDERYLLACTRYVEMNPVRGGLVTTPTDWPWSSAHAHATRCNDTLVTVEPLLDMIGDSWADFLAAETPPDEAGILRKHERSGRPLGSPAFIASIEGRLQRVLQPKKTGRKPRNAETLY